MRGERHQQQADSPAGRRGFLEALACTIAATVGLVLGRRPRAQSPGRKGMRATGPRELDLDEADLFGPHDLAG